MSQLCHPGFDASLLGEETGSGGLDGGDEGCTVQPSYLRAMLPVEGLRGRTETLTVQQCPCENGPDKI